METEAEHRPFITKQSTASTGSSCHSSSQAISYFHQPQTRVGTEVSNSQKQEAGITCPAGMDSKESEHPRAMGWSSGVRLSVDERLLARASSCTNMIPGETRGRRVGQRGRESSHSTNGAGPLRYQHGRGLVRPPNTATWITEQNGKTEILK